MVFGGDVFFVYCERVVTSLEISCLHVVIAPQKQVFYFKPEKYLINIKKILLYENGKEIWFCYIRFINDQFSQNILNYKLCYQGKEFIGAH